MQLKRTVKKIGKIVSSNTENALYRYSSYLDLVPGLVPSLQQYQIISPSAWTRTFGTSASMEEKVNTMLKGGILRVSLDMNSYSQELEYAMFVCRAKHQAADGIAAGVASLVIDRDYITPSGNVNHTMMNPKRWKILAVKRGTMGLTPSGYLPLSQTSIRTLTCRIPPMRLFNYSFASSTGVASWKDLQYPRKMTDNVFVFIFTNLSPTTPLTLVPAVELTCFYKVQTL